jgi:hypothetical protein
VVPVQRRSRVWSRTQDVRTAPFGPMQTKNEAGPRLAERFPRKPVFASVQHVCLAHCCDRYSRSTMGSRRRPTQRDSETGAIPSRAAAALRFLDARMATIRSVAFSMSGSEAHSC